MSIWLSEMISWNNGINGTDFQYHCKPTSFYTGVCAGFFFIVQNLPEIFQCQLFFKLSRKYIQEAVKTQCRTDAVHWVTTTFIACLSNDIWCWITIPIMVDPYHWNKTIKQKNPSILLHLFLLLLLFTGYVTIERLRFLRTPPWSWRWCFTVHCDHSSNFNCQLSGSQQISPLPL